jgi:transcriptional regulator with XRE-family HTH domain
MSDLFIDKLIELQKEHGLSNQEMCERLGIGDTMWHYIRKGQRNPGGSTMRRAIHTFPVLVNYL